jgi:hypothetical protein
MAAKMHITIRIKGIIAHSLKNSHSFLHFFGFFKNFSRFFNFLPCQ